MATLSYDHSPNDEVFILFKGAVISGVICQMKADVYLNEDDVLTELVEYIVQATYNNSENIYTVPASDVYNDVDVALAALRATLVP